MDGGQGRVVEEQPLDARVNYQTLCIRGALVAAVHMAVLALLGAAEHEHLRNTLVLIAL